MGVRLPPRAPPNGRRAVPMAAKPKIHPGFRLDKHTVPPFSFVSRAARRVFLYFFNTTGKISAAAQITGEGTHKGAVSASSSPLAPIPVAGPQFRLYLTKSLEFSPRRAYAEYLFSPPTISECPSPSRSPFMQVIDLVASDCQGSRQSIRG
jgi:hypothetical protein